MRRFALLLLASFAATAEPPAPAFELPPPGGDWDALPPDHDDVQARFRTAFPDSDATAEVRVMAYAISEKLAARELAAIVAEWAPLVEKAIEQPRLLGEGEAKLGGEEARFRDVRNDSARLTWHLARVGRSIYVFHVLRTHGAMEDADLEEEIATIRGSLRFLKRAEPDPVPPKPPPVKDEVPAALLARETIRFDHWRFECVKPEGLVRVPPEKFDQAEKDSGVAAKFERKGDAGLMMVRVYARARSTQRSTIEELAGQKVKRFEEAYDEAHRKPVVRDDAWKFPMAEKAIRLELTGRRTTVQVARWYLAQCRNGRQYEIEIFVSGAEEEWAARIRDVVEGFRPLRE